MRIVVMGTGPFAVPTFRWLLGSSHEVPALITRPSKTSRRRSSPARNPMRDVAESASIAVHCPESINADEALNLLESLEPELLVVCDYGQILSKATLATPELGGINLHASLLPAYRGAAPINWAMFDGCAETGVSVIHMTPKLDGGPILVVKSTPIRDDEDAAVLEVRLAEIGVTAVAESIELLVAWDRHSQIGMMQDQDRATRAPRLTKNEGAVDWSRSATQLAQQVRAFQPWPGSFTFWKRDQGEPLRLVLEKTSVEQSDTTGEQPPGSMGEQPPESMGQAPGNIVTAAGDHLVVVTGDGLLRIDQIRPAGKRVMTAAEFLRGNPIKVGDLLSGASPSRTVND